MDAGDRERPAQASGEPGIPWRDLYTRVLLRHLSAPSEETLAEAYGLGRAGISAGLGQSAIVSHHHDLLLSRPPDPVQLGRAGDFLAEALAPFEMLQRGFRATIEKQAELNRQLQQRSSELERAQQTIARLHRERTVFLAEASRELATSLDSALVAQCIVRLATPRLAGWASVQLTAAASAAGPGAQGPLFTSGTSREPPSPEAEAERLVPLSVGDREVGVLRLGRPAAPADVQDGLVAEFASRAALALDNAGHFEEATRAIELRDEFLSVASHELKTPLTPLLMGLDVLAEVVERAGTPRHQKALERSLRQVHRLRRLVQDLLDGARIRRDGLQLVMQRFDLRELLQEQAEVFAHDPRGGEIQVTLPDAPLWVEADPFRMEQVVMNLLDNAFKYGPRGALVELVAERRGGQVEVSVRDRGIGVPTEDRALVFQPWFRARNASVRHYGGLGLGLHICSEILTHHGGGIRLEPAEGGGSRFTFSLPAAPPPPSDG